MKSIKIAGYSIGISMLIALVLLAPKAYGQFNWCGSGTSTITDGYVDIGNVGCIYASMPGATPPRLHIATQDAEVGLSISNGNGGSVDIVSVYNSMFFPATPVFSINGSGQTGVGLQADAAKPYIFDVAGQSHFSDKVFIGDYAIRTSAANSTNDYKLFVEKGLLTEKVKVAIYTSGDWYDHVFSNEYKLRSLNDVEQFIKENKHLPDIPSAEEVVQNGLDLGKMDGKLLQKIEELTLYMIDQKKELALLKKENADLKNEVKKIARNNH